jgi:hypothetical protein
MELTKSDKKIARIIIEKGLLKEFEDGLNKADSILTDWKECKGDPRATYHALFAHIRAFDKGIAKRYDGMRNSDLLFILAHQVNEQYIDQEEFEAFSEDGKSIIRRLLD